MNTVQKIWYLLKKNNLTANELSKKLNISNASISAWKRGTTKSYINYIDKIAQILDVTPEYLLNEDETDNNTDISPTQRLFNFLTEKKNKAKSTSRKNKYSI